MLAKIQAYLWAAIVFGALYTGWIFLSRSSGMHAAAPGSSARDAEFERVYGTNAVKILTFHAQAADAVEGQRTLLCYGVLNAVSVRMEPPVEGLTPAVNRCIGITETRATRYTLIAEGRDGTMVSASFLLGVRAEAETLPEITSFEVVERKPDYRGRMVFLLSFGQRNGVEISIDPPAFPMLHGSPYGRFYVAPESTTTYTLTVKGKFGHQVQRKLTLEVPKI